ncbi:unnamed protein product [Adineta steineri]|nr:unnamed protein product [Adineta steineri]
MTACNDFIILAMNDRRLLTLMIADPDDTMLQSKIQALPSRSLKRDSNSAAQKVMKQIEAYQDMSSDDYDSDLNENDDNINSIKKTPQPITSYRYVHRLNGKLSSSKMKTDESYRTYFLANYIDRSDEPDTTNTMIDDSDSGDDNDDVITETPPQVENTPIKQEHNLDDIHEKTMEHDRQQIKGIQLANVGVNNPKIMNDYSVTSNTCILL